VVPLLSLSQKRIKCRKVWQPQRGGIFIANAITLKMSPSGAAHTPLGVAPLGLKTNFALYSINMSPRWGSNVVFGYKNTQKKWISGQKKAQPKI
jgi:hypothetical protein